MIHFCKLVALLSFLLSTTFALPREGTSPGRSPTVLHPAGANPQSNIHDVYFVLPGRLGVEHEGSSDWASPTYLSAEAEERVGLLTRGDPPLNAAIEHFDEVAKLVMDPHGDYTKIIDALRKGEEAVVNAKLPLGKETRVPRPGEIIEIRPVWPKVDSPSRFIWPEHRLNTAPSNLDQASTSGNKVSWPGK
ncbi:hypothetical protein CF327_g7124 [Tilletia walkeri]|uniref:Uncharacterized protein n=1 Tax=Tilletia walkeri TaxID=117179 RepID=A0A8X7T1N1_9BASI|nr:hypothetical protein CF327_g7124 [Tilletia walkeri]KAE8262540.1 hypothetical protein A4X09_0g7436 [Tilletia walkeri]